MYNIKLIPYLVLYKYMFYIITPQFIVKSLWFWTKQHPTVSRVSNEKRLYFQNHVIPDGICFVMNTYPQQIQKPKE